MQTQIARQISQNDWLNSKRPVKQGFDASFADMMQTDEERFRQQVLAGHFQRVTASSLGSSM